MQDTAFIAVGDMFIVFHVVIIATAIRDDTIDTRINGTGTAIAIPGPISSAESLLAAPLSVQTGIIDGAGNVIGRMIIGPTHISPTMGPGGSVCLPIFTDREAWITTDIALMLPQKRRG